MTTTLERVRAAVIKAVPEIVDRDITLADVLRTMPWGVHLTTTGDDIRMVAYDREGSCLGLEYWNPRLPLHLQSEEALTFLNKTLNHD